MIKNITKYPVQAGFHLVAIRNPELVQSSNVNNPIMPTDRIRALALNYELELLTEEGNPTGIVIPSGVSLASRHGRRAPIIRLAKATNREIDPENIDAAVFADAVLGANIELIIPPPYQGLRAVARELLRI